MLSFSSKAIPVNMLASTIVNALPSNIRTKVDGGMSSGISVNDKPTQSTVSVPASYVQPASSMEAVSVGRGKCSKFVPAVFVYMRRQNTLPSVSVWYDERDYGWSCVDGTNHQAEPKQCEHERSEWFLFLQKGDW